MLNTIRICNGKYRYDPARVLGGELDNICIAFDNENNEYAVKQFETDDLIGFRNEVRILKHLQERNFEEMPRFYDECTLDGQGYIVMEKLEGTLSSLFKTDAVKSPLIFNQILDFIRKAVMVLNSLDMRHTGIHAEHIMYKSVNDSTERKYQFYLIDSWWYSVMKRETDEEKLIMEQCIFSFNSIIAELWTAFDRYAILDLTLFPGNEVFRSSIDLAPIYNQKATERDKMTFETDESMENFWEGELEYLQELYEIKKTKFSFDVKECAWFGDEFRATVSIDDQSRNLTMEEMLYIGISATTLTEIIRPYLTSYRELKRKANTGQIQK